jgi:hypothetical protein
MKRLAVEWGKLEKVPPEIELLSGERRRDSVLTSDEDQEYLRAAQMIGERHRKCLRARSRMERAQAAGRVVIVLGIVAPQARQNALRIQFGSC